MKPQFVLGLFLPIFVLVTQASDKATDKPCGDIQHTAAAKPELAKDTSKQIEKTATSSSQKEVAEKEGGPCELTITADDGMSFSSDELTIKKSCDKFTINFENKGVIPKSTMGHNIVISKKSDTNALASEGMSAGAEHDYLPPDDKRIIAKTPILGGGEKSSITFSTDVFSKDEEYQFFCSFPGHFFTMKGDVTVE